MATEQQLQDRLTSINEQITKYQSQIDANPDDSDSESYKEFQSQLNYWNGKKEEIEFALNG